MREEKRKLIDEILRMLNEIGLRRAVGQDYNWTKGMFRHHISRLFPIIDDDDSFTYVTQNLTDNARNGINEYFLTEMDAGNITPDDQIKLLNCGVLILDERKKGGI